MSRLFTGVASAVALALSVTAAQANAEGLRGFRAEAQTGISSFHSEGASKSKWGWGGAAGVDFDLGGFVLGGEGKGLHQTTARHCDFLVRIPMAGAGGAGVASLNVSVAAGVVLFEWRRRQVEHGPQD